MFQNFMHKIFKTINIQLKNKKTNNIFVLINIQSHEIIYNNFMKLFEKFKIYGLCGFL